MAKGKGEARRRTVTVHLDDLLEVTFVGFYGAKYNRIYDAIVAVRWWIPNDCRLLTITYKAKMGNAVVCIHNQPENCQASLWVSSEWFGKKYTDKSRLQSLYHEIGHILVAALVAKDRRCTTDKAKLDELTIAEENIVDKMAWVLVDRLHPEGKK